MRQPEMLVYFPDTEKHEEISAVIGEIYKNE